MNNTRPVKRMLLNGLLGAILLGSCSIGLEPDSSGPEKDLERVDQEIIGLTARSAVTAAEAQLAERETPASNSISVSTTYNFKDDSVFVEVPDGGEADLPERTNYPYPNWTTGGTITHRADPAAFDEDNGWTEEIADQFSGDLEIFQVSAVARPDEAGVYPEEAVREVYYIVSPDMTVDITDQAKIFDPFGLSGTAYRDEYVAEYSDGSSRYHWILNTYAEGSAAKMARFNIDGSMEFADVYTEAVSAGGDDDARFSSLTLYTHELGKTYNYWFWNDNDDVNPLITGMRYYTEHVDLERDEYVATSVTFEYTTNSASDGSIRLARTTIREEMVFELTEDEGAGIALDHTLRSRTEINNSSGGDDLLYTSNGKRISDFANRGNSQPQLIKRVVRDVLPANYSDIAQDFDVDLTWVD